MTFKILFQDADFVFIDKPAGYFVHPPEDPGLARFCDPARVILSQLRRQIGQFLYPVHRLDVGTSGVLCFALSSEAARGFQGLLTAGGVRKEYELLCRGWCESQVVELPLPNDVEGVMVPAATVFEELSRFEVAGSPVPGISTQRYTFMKASPLTGRYHQIRRHLARLSHPIIGDGQHGDSKQNRFFRERFGVSGLCLRAVGLGFGKYEVQAAGQWGYLKKLEIVKPVGQNTQAIEGVCS